jgi:hypothetical protein
MYLGFEVAGKGYTFSTTNAPLDGEVSPFYTEIP